MKTYLCVLPREENKRDVVLVTAGSVSELFWTLDEFTNPYAYLIKPAPGGVAISITQEVVEGEEELNYWGMLGATEYPDGPQLTEYLEYCYLQAGKDWKRLGRRPGTTGSDDLILVPLTKEELEVQALNSDPEFEKQEEAA